MSSLVTLKSAICDLALPSGRRWLRNFRALHQHGKQSCANAQETYAYNKRLQPAVIELGTTGNPTADYCLVYNYYGSSPTSCALPSAGTSDNGNVMGYWYQDSVNSSFSHTATYTYDGVNRLSTAVATGSSTYNLTFSYDRYGNMTCQTNGQTNGPCPNWAYNPSTNQLATSGFPYDAAGNLTKDSSNPTAHTWQWDGEGRAASVDSGSTWGFTYNALGDRAQWAYTGGADQHLFDPAGTWVGNAGSYTLVPLGGRYFVVYTSSETNFDHINALGSTTMWTSHSGAELEDILFYPWGDLWKGSGGYNFASLPYRDLKTNTDFTAYRVYSPNLGRWLSPDPVGGDATNPQSLNRYPYVMNNPTTSIDPLGLGGPSWISPKGVFEDCDLFLGCGGDGGGWDEFDLLGLALEQAENQSTTTYTYDVVTVNGTSTGVTIDNGAGIETDESLWDPGVTYWIPTGVVYGASDSSNSVGGFIDQVPVAWSINIPVPVRTPAGLVPGPGGPAIAGAVHVPGATNGCVGGGWWAGTPGAKTVSVGPLLVGSLSNSKAVLSGWSWSLNIQGPVSGFQVTWNSSGVLAGPTLGLLPGVSLSRTWSGCN